MEANVGIPLQEQSASVSTPAANPVPCLGLVSDLDKPAGMKQIPAPRFNEI